VCDRRKKAHGLGGLGC